jgi:signal transduction histidine kinase
MQLTDDRQEPGADEIEEFMSAAAHDLRNPIAVVRASAQMAQRQIPRGDIDGAQGRLKAIVAQTDRLTEMIETFLDASRISAQRLQLRTERAELLEIVEAAANRARLLVGEDSNREMEFRVPVGLVGAWDRPRIVRAIRALIANALLYGDSSAPVLLEACRNGNRVQLCVSGGGPGPSIDEAQHLFERFFRGPSAAEAGQSGSGLGLFIARGIARLHGGEVRRLEGDRFEIELPLIESIEATNPLNVNTPR